MPKTTKSSTSPKPILKKIGGLGTLVLAPTLLALYPILFLYSRNIQEVPANLLVKPLLIVASGSLVLMLLLWWIIKDKTKASLISSLFWIFFFFYNAFFVYAASLLPMGLERQRYLLPLWALVFASLAVLIWRSQKLTNKLFQATLGIGIIMVALQFVGIVRYSATPPQTNAFDYLLNKDDKKLTPAGHPLPDIYYIMPDGYPRTDTLKQYFGFDNKDFDNFLKSKGFYIATKSHSNYNQTGLSMPSTMNMSYLIDLHTKSLDTTKLINLYQHNKVLSYLKSGGYKFINNSNLYSTKFNDAADFNIDCGKTNEFFKELVDTTILKPFKLISNQERKDLRADANCVIDHIGGQGGPAGPKFVFNHLLPPHPPYIFGDNGQDVTDVNLSLTALDRWQAKKPYLAQLKYVNRRLEEAVSEILAKQPESIIIIQSDHGTLSSAALGHDPLRDTSPQVLIERSRNKFAVHLPDFCDKSKLYSSITNVNTFRLIFNSCFGADYQLFADTIYYVTPGPGRFFNYQDITNLVKD